MIDFLTSFDNSFTTRAINKGEMAALPEQLTINTSYMLMDVVCLIYILNN